MRTARVLKHHIDFDVDNLDVSDHHERMADSAFAFKPRRQASKFRRFVTPLTILLVAIPVIWWGANRDSARREKIRATIQALCNSAGDHKLKPSDIPARYPIVQTQIFDRLNLLTAGDWKKNAESLSISVTHGDTEPNSNATHVATLSIAGTALLGLRMEYDTEDDRVIFTGMFDPGE